MYKYSKIQNGYFEKKVHIDYEIARTVHCRALAMPMELY